MNTADNTDAETSLSGRPVIKFAYTTRTIYLLIPNQGGEGFDRSPMSRGIEKLFAKTIRRGVGEENGMLWISLAKDFPNVLARHNEEQRARFATEIVEPLAKHLGFEYEEISWGDLLDLHKPAAEVAAPKP